MSEETKEILAACLERIAFHTGTNPKNLTEMLTGYAWDEEDAGRIKREIHDCKKEPEK